MLSKYPISVLCIGLFFISTLNAAEPGNVKRKDTISLYDAIYRANASHPALSALNYQLSAQQANAIQAGLSASPKVRLEIADAGGSGNFQGFDSAQTTLGIAWFIEGDIRDGYQGLANANTQSVLTETKLKRLEISSETARLYMIGLANQTRLKMNQQSVALAANTVAEIKKRRRAGKNTTADLARAEAELARRKLDAEDIEHELDSSYHLLAAQWGETKPGFSQLSGNIFKLPQPIAFESLEQRLPQNPEFIRLLSQRNVKQAALQLEKSKSSSPWEVNLAVRQYELTQDQALVAGISIPFGERSRNSAGIARAQAQLSRLDAEEKAIQVQYITSLFVQYQEYKHNLHRVKAYREEIIPKLKFALKKTQRAYQVGRYSYLEWQSVQSELITAQTELLESSIEAHLKMIEIERLTGVQLAQPNKSNKI